jgi:hypothetical protein
VILQAIHTIHHDQDVFTAGAVFELEGPAAQRLLDLGAATPADGDVAAGATKAKAAARKPKAAKSTDQEATAETDPE